MANRRIISPMVRGRVSSIDFGEGTLASMATHWESRERGSAPFIMMCTTMTRASSQTTGSAWMRCASWTPDLPGAVNGELDWRKVAHCVASGGANTPRAHHSAGVRCGKG